MFLTSPYPERPVVGLLSLPLYALGQCSVRGPLQFAKKAKTALGNMEDQAASSGQGYHLPAVANAYTLLAFRHVPAPVLPVLGQAIIRQRPQRLDDGCLVVSNSRAMTLTGSTSPGFSLPSRRCWRIPSRAFSQKTVS